MSENRRIVVDPVTRIEGHLRVQAVLGEDNVIRDAQSTGTMWLTFACRPCSGKTT